MVPNPRHRKALRDPALPRWIFLAIVLSLVPHDMM
jgi:hypothetical protein